MGKLLKLRKTFGSSFVRWGGGRVRKIPRSRMQVFFVLQETEAYQKWIARNILRRMRLKQGYTIVQASQVLEVSTTTLRQWETGVIRPSKFYRKWNGAHQSERGAALTRIADFCGVEPEDLQEWWEGWFDQRLTMLDRLSPSGLYKKKNISELEREMEAALHKKAPWPGDEPTAKKRRGERVPTASDQ